MKNINKTHSTQTKQKILKSKKPLTDFKLKIQTSEEQQTLALQKMLNEAEKLRCIEQQRKNLLTMHKALLFKDKWYVSRKEILNTAIKGKRYERSWISSNSSWEQHHMDHLY